MHKRHDWRKENGKAKKKRRRRHRHRQWYCCIEPWPYRTQILLSYCYMPPTSHVSNSKAERTTDRRNIKSMNRLQTTTDCLFRSLWNDANLVLVIFSNRLSIWFSVATNHFRQLLRHERKAELITTKLLYTERQSTVRIMWQLTESQRMSTIQPILCAAFIHYSAAP